MATNLILLLVVKIKRTMQSGHWIIYSIFLMLVACNKIHSDYKEFKFNKFEISLSRIDTLKGVDLFDNKRLFYLKQAPDQCISFYNGDLKCLIKACKDTFYVYPIFKNEAYKILENYTWINDSLILINCNVLHLNGYHDEAIFIYNTQTQEKEMLFNFEETGLSHSELDINSPLYIRGNFLKNYITINSQNFESVFIKKDSSLILPVLNSYSDTLSHDSVLDARNNKNMLVRVYNNDSKKRAEIIPLTFANLYPRSVLNGYLSQFMNRISGKQITKDEIILGTPISDRLVVYNFKDHSHKVVEGNPLFEQPSGDRSINDAIRGDQVDSNKHDYFQTIHGNATLNLYFRPIKLGITPIHKSPEINTRYVIQVLDSNFKLLGFIPTPSNQKFIGLDSDDNLIFYDPDKSVESNTIQLNIYKLNIDYKKVREVLPRFKPIEIKPFAPQADIKGYVKEMIPNSNKYSNFVIIPIDRICPTCRDCLKCYLDKVEETDPKTAIIILLQNNNSTQDFKHLEHVFYDDHFLFMKYFRTDGFIPLFRKEKKGFQFVKSFMPTSPEELTEFINPNVSIFEIGCDK